MRFQSCLERLQAGENATAADGVVANTELMHLSEDFIYVSRSVGKIIISEVYVPVEKKLIKPSTLGGRAGGEKYVVHNILFKFAVDSFNLFDGSNWAAAKVFSSQLISSFPFSCFVPFLFLPLTLLLKGGKPRVKGFNELF